MVILLSSTEETTGTVDNFLNMFSTIVDQRAWEIASVSEGGKVFVDPDAQSLEPLLEKPSRAAITSFLQLGSQHAYHDPTMPTMILPCLHKVDPILLL